VRGLPSRIRWAVSAALGGLVANPVTTAVAVITLSATLVLVGGFWMALSGLETVLDRAAGQMRIVAWVDESLDAEAREALRRRVAELPGVAAVDLVDPGEAERRFRERFGARFPILDVLEGEPLPASLEIVPGAGARAPEAVARLRAAVSELPGVEELGYGSEWLERYASVLDLMRGLAVGIGAVLVLATLLIVGSTIRLAVHARREELEILDLVGASRAFIATPFLLEGLIEGVAGGLLAAVGLRLAVALAEPLLGDGLLWLGSFEGPGPRVASGLALVAAGGLLGLVGSAAAVAGGLER